MPYEFLPDPASILEEIVPVSFKVRLFKCFLDAAVSEQIARVIWACRARLYSRVSDLIMSSAFSVAPRMATMREICSLTAASRKHLKSRTLNETGTISSRMLLGSGRNSYGVRSPRVGAGRGGRARRLGLADRGHALGDAGRGHRQERLHDRFLPRGIDETRVRDVEPVDLTAHVEADKAVGQLLHVVELRPDVLVMGVARVERDGPGTGSS